MQIREKATKVLVAGAVLDKEGDLKVRGFKSRVWKFDGGSHESAEAVLLGGEMGTDRSVDSHMVDEGDGLVAKLSCPVDEILRLAGAPEEGEGGTGVEFGKQVRSRFPENSVSAWRISRSRQASHS